MTIRESPHGPERNRQDLWISVSRGVSVVDDNERDAEFEASLAAQFSSAAGT